MNNLSEKIALVTGASRGVGKGVALGLAEAEAVVYITGRTVSEGASAVSLPGNILQTAAEAREMGGQAIAMQCDHRRDEEVRVVFEQIQEEQRHLDILVNNVWGGYEHFNDGTEFWKEKGFWTEPLSRWEAMFDSGVRAHYISSVFAAPMMIAQGQGLIVNISSFGAYKKDAGVLYSMAKTATDQMAAAMAHELRDKGVAVVSLYPGLVRTESVLKASDYFDLSNSESPQFIGRAVAALAADPQIMERSGQTLIAAELALEYGFTDIDGKQPRSLSE